MTIRYENGLPQHNLLEREEQFLVKNWQEGATLYEVDSSDFKLNKHCEAEGINCLYYGFAPSHEKDRPYFAKYLMLIPPSMIEDTFHEIVFKCEEPERITENAHWSSVRLAERLTSIWQWEYQFGR